MKLQIFILAVGIAVSAGAVSAELNRSAGTTSVTQSVSASISAAQSSLKQSSTTAPAHLLTGVKPSIKGVSGEDD